MEKKLKILCMVLLICAAGMSLTVCGVKQESINWIAPMLSFTTSSGVANIYNGEINVARTNSTEEETPVVRTGQVTTAGITEASLINNGAIKATAKLSYNGNDEFLVRFRVLIDEFSGHSVVNRRLPNASGDNKDRILVLWKDSNGTWWDIRRSSLGTANTGGTENQFTLEFGRNADITAIAINKDTVSKYASLDFYIIVLDLPRQHEEVAGYIITYYMELPDRYAGHFHGYEILVSTSTAIAVE
jgi:hypothetical protein